MNTKIVTRLVFAIYVSWFSNALSAATVLPGPDLATSITSLGIYGPGTYNITATGVVALAGTLGSESANFDLGPDGVPIADPDGVTFNDPTYAHFNPGGSDTADAAGTLFGPGGAGINLGAVMGTYSATPTLPSDWFLIGNSFTVTLLDASTEIWAAVNDTYYLNNSGSFDVVVNQVPLPAAAWLFGSALLGLVTVARRKQLKA